MVTRVCNLKNAFEKFRCFVFKTIGCSRKIEEFSDFVSRCTTIRSNMPTVIPLLASVLAIGTVAVQGCSVPAQYKELAGQIRPLCIDESGTTADVIDGTCDGNFPDDPKLKTYIKCVAVMLDMVVRENINFNVVIDMIPAAAKGRLTQAVNSCRNEGGDKMLDRIYNIVKCIYKADSEDFFMP